MLISKTFGLNAWIICNNCGGFADNSSCLNKYSGLSSLKKTNEAGCDNSTSTLYNEILTYIWCEEVCSMALINCWASKSSLVVSKLFASSATLGWNSNDLLRLDWVGRESEIGNSLSTTKTQHKK